MGGTIISAFVVTAYFMAGGLLSSAWVNAVQLVVLLVGFAVAVPLVVSSVGGLEHITRGPEMPSTFSNFVSSAGPLSGWTLLVFAPAFVVSPGLMQKAYGAVSARAVRIGIGLQAVVLAIFAFAPPLLGMAARAAHPGLSNPNIVLPTVLVEQLPPWFGALALAAVFSAEVSTCDAILFMLATSLSQDLYKRFLQPDADDREVLTIARLASIAGGAGAVVLALLLETVQSALAVFYALLGVSLLVPVVGGLYVRRAGAPEALGSIVAGNLALLMVRFGPPRLFATLDPTVSGLVASAAAFAVDLCSEDQHWSPVARTSKGRATGDWMPIGSNVLYENAPHRGSCRRRHRQGSHPRWHGRSESCRRARRLLAGVQLIPMGM